MRTAKIKTSLSENSSVVLTVEFNDSANLTGYEFDHLGNIVVSYLLAVGFDRVEGPKSVRPHKTDAELEAEMDDFIVVREQHASPDALRLVPRAPLTEQVGRSARRNGMR